ncbi:DUF350 domain-containing protein [Nevskia sp.]|uniref:DUF350 domain-containing protein n=1 Tax=Nevskia sp. TaxID=1929292 RepID=UPI0025D1E3B4|nr:DUF350 domain-containing protein [Nevskia sp.]
MAPYLTGLPAFAAWLGLSLLLLVIFVGLYVTATPPREIKLIREGNVSAAVCLSGAMLGFVLPLASAMVHGANLIDFLVWGLIAAVVQMLAYVAIRLIFRRMPEDIIEDRLAIAVMTAGVSVAVGVLNAAAMFG